MHRKELNKRSPLRVLESSIHGGLGKGNLGLIVARHGVGKTAFLVDVAMDDLLRGRNVLHVSLEEPMEKVCAFYDEIFTDLAHAQDLEDVWQARLFVEQHRRIQCYPGVDFSADTLRAAVRFWKSEGGFTPAALIVDGWDFERKTPAELRDLKTVAAECDAEMWMSAVASRDAARDARGVPEPVSRVGDQADVILSMAHDGQSVHLTILKDHENLEVAAVKLSLDPKTMLLVEE